LLNRGAEKDGDSMPEIQSTRDAILFGIPMLGLLILNFFRLDHLLARKQESRRSTERGRPLSHTRETGQFVCVEPGCEFDDSEYRQNKSAASGAQRLKPQVIAYWAEKDCWE
jgi:hypothetical protein